jgi:PII-like signaling protein
MAAMPDSGASSPLRDARKLTVYFGERVADPSGGFLAERLLDLFGRHRVASSILLRGVEGFGLRHHLRSDQSLSLSEDPPLVAVAVDEKETVEGLVAAVAELGLRGLITVERARVMRNVLAPVTLPEELAEAAKMTIYVGRQERIGRQPAFMAICHLLRRQGLAGASVFLGVDGTAHGVRERARFFDRNAEVPMMIAAVGAGDRIAAVLPELGGLLRRPLISLERVRVCKRDGALLDRPHELPEVDGNGFPLWQKLTVYASESTRYRRAPLHRALIRRLRSDGLSKGATALRGIWGFHGDHDPHGDRLFQLRRRVPVTTIAIDEPTRIAAAFEVIDEMTQERGLVTSEMVPALVVAQPERRHGEFRLARHSY